MPVPTGPSLFATDRSGSLRASMTYPKIELHVHAEGAVRPETLLRLARRNGVALPADSVEGLRELFRFQGFEHFIQVWLLIAAVLRTADDFRQIISDYAEDAAAHGAVYIEAIVAPLQAVRRGVSWEDVFEGCCDGAQEARELHGVEVRITPDMTRDASPEEIERTVDYCLAYRERGVVGLGLGAYEDRYPPSLFANPFRRAREGGLGSVPHAGETAGPESVWQALDLLGAHRIRHGFRAADDPALVQELAARGTVLDVCPISNVQIGVVASLDAHPLPRLLEAGVRCSLSTDDPAMLDTHLTVEYETARARGLSPRDFYEAGVAGALCDEQTRARLKAIGDAFDWSALDPAEGIALGGR